MQTLQNSIAHRCGQCGSGLLAGEGFCEACGTPRPPRSATLCEHCGALALDTEGFCQQCGLRSVPKDKPLRLELSGDCAGLSDRGLRRLLNQDAIALLALPPSQPECWGLVVCDGISSSARAEWAAQLAAATLGEDLRVRIISHARDDSPLGEGDTGGELKRCVHGWTEALARSLDLAQQSVARLAPANSDAPATTAVVAVVCDSMGRLGRDRQLILGWLGDSRAYWLTAQGGQQLTLDHSDTSHRLTHWLGADADWQKHPPQFASFVLEGPGYVLLCSDGLWNYAPKPEQLWQILHPDADQSRDLDAAVLTQRLIDFARDRGGHDNISAVLLRVPTPQVKSPRPHPPVTPRSPSS